MINVTVSYKQCACINDIYILILSAINVLHTSSHSRDSAGDNNRVTQNTHNNP